MSIFAFLRGFAADAFIQATCFQKQRSNLCVAAIQRLCSKIFLILCKPLCQANKTLLDEKALLDWADETQWLGLDIVKTETLTKTQSAVEFKAHFQGREQPQVHHEHSIFVKIDGRWYFVDPTVPLPSNKQPCVCGSGKKFKHCCGGLL